MYKFVPNNCLCCMQKRQSQTEYYIVIRYEKVWNFYCVFVRKEMSFIVLSCPSNYVNTQYTALSGALAEGSIWILSLLRSKLHLYLVLREDLFYLSTWTLGGVVWSVRWQISYQEMIYVTTLTLLETMMNLISSCLLKQLNTFVLWTSIVVFQQVNIYEL